MAAYPVNQKLDHSYTTCYSAGYIIMCVLPNQIVCSVSVEAMYSEVSQSHDYWFACICDSHVTEVY